MADISFDIAGIFEKTFGYKTHAFDPEFTGVQGIRGPDRTEQGSYGSPYYAADTMGMEYYMPVTLSFPENGDAILKKWNLPYPVISITSRKTIIETPLTERRGTVKELINIQDYEITIRGFIIARADEFPENDVTTLRNVYEQNVALSIQCPLTDIFLLRPDRSGSDQVVIQALNFPGVSGVKNVRPYELRLVSDEAFSLTTIS